MNMKLIVSILISTSFLSSSCHAFFCPNNFNQIDYGDSIAQVEQQCGKADSTAEAEAPDNSPQEWTYYLQQSNSVNNMPQAQQAEGSLKTSFAFDSQGKLVSISVNGIGVASTSNCGSPVSIGDSRKSVESTCGKPTFVNKQAPSSSSQGADKNKQVEMTYKGSPAVTLVFRDGRLAEKR